MADVAAADVTELVALVGQDEFVNGVAADIVAREDAEFKALPGQSLPPIHRDESWDKYMYFFYVGAGVTHSSGFRYTGATWIPLPVTRPTQERIRSVLTRIRDSAEVPVPDRWNAAVITYDRASQTGDLHLFYGDEAELWQLTPANRDRIAAQGLALFDRKRES